MYEKRVREYLFEHPDLCNGSARAVEVSLLHECISDLKLHKAASHDGIYNEHIIHAGPQPVVHLCLLFTAMMRHSFVLTSDSQLLNHCWNAKMVICIVELPWPQCCLNYLSLCCWDSIVSIWLVIHCNLGLKKAAVAITLCLPLWNPWSTSLREAVRSAVLFLMPFDKVLINGLLNKLIDRKIPFHFIWLLYNWYSNLSCAVVWNTAICCPFPVTCGVRQGGVLSFSVCHLRRWCN